MRQVAWRPWLVVALALLGVLEASDARAQWSLSDPEKESSLKIGLLVQPQAEWLEMTTGEDTSQNLFLRRVRLLFGGNINNDWSFFVETDSPNLGKAKDDGTKTTDFFLQDAFLTYSAGDVFKLDFGMLLIPVSHNSQQGAGTLLPVDYGPYSFLASDPTLSKVGRDYGAQARGYVANKHFEYRAGLFQGARGTTAQRPLRYAVRAVWYPFEADTGFFYTGTTLGARRILGVGASYDRQSDYKATAVDVFWDQPLGNGDAVTLQADWIRYDGGETFTTLVEQDAWLLEAAYYFKSWRLSPFVQLASRDPEPETSAGEDKYLAGVAWWPSGHKLNVKLAAGQIDPENGPSRTQIVLQCQLFAW